MTQLDLAGSDSSQTMPYLFARIWPSHCRLGSFSPILLEMKHIAAYLLIRLTNPKPTKQDVTALLETVGIEADKERLDNLFTELDRRDVGEACFTPR